MELYRRGKEVDMVKFKHRLLLPYFGMVI